MSFAEQYVLTACGEVEAAIRTFLAKDNPRRAALLLVVSNLREGVKDAFNRDAEEARKE